MVEAFGPSVGYLSLEGLAAARKIAETITQAALGAGPSGHVDLP